MIADINPICVNVLVLRIIYFAKLFINVLRFLIPIILIVKVGIDIYTQMMNPDNSDRIKGIKNKIIAAVIVFLIPTVVSVIINIIDSMTGANHNSTLHTCLEFSTDEYITELQKIESDNEYLEELEELYLSGEEKSLSEYEKKVRLARAQIEENAASAIDQSSDNTSDNTIDLSKRTIAGVIKCDEDRSNYNGALSAAVNKAGRKTRAGVVAAAKYLANDIGVSIPYFWSGGHFHNFKDSKGQAVSDEGNNFKGIHKKWGCDVKMSGKGTDMQKHGSLYPFGLDCSGFVAWSIYNGGYGTSSAKGLRISLGDDDLPLSSVGGTKVKSVSLSKSKGQVKAGDLITKTHHIGMIIEVKDNLLLVAEEKGYKYGLVISEIKYDDKRFTHVTLMDNFYANYRKSESTW